MIASQTGGGNNLDYDFSYELISFSDHIIRFQVHLDETKKYGYYFSKDKLTIKFADRYVFRTTSDDNKQGVAVLTSKDQKEVFEITVNDDFTDEIDFMVTFIVWLLKIMLIPSAVIYFVIITNTTNCGFYFIVLYISAI